MQNIITEERRQITPIILQNGGVPKDIVIMRALARDVLNASNKLKLCKRGATRQF